MLLVFSPHAPWFSLLLRSPTNPHASIPPSRSHAPFPPFHSARTLSEKCVPAVQLPLIDCMPTISILYSFPSFPSLDGCSICLLGRHDAATPGRPVASGLPFPLCQDITDRMRMRSCFLNLRPRSKHFFTPCCPKAAPLCPSLLFFFFFSFFPTKIVVLTSTTLFHAIVHLFLFFFFSSFPSSCSSASPFFFF